MADQERTPRGTDNREATSRPSDKWVPASALPVPNPIEGWKFRWIRTGSQGNSDNTNVSKKFREGWVAVMAADHPELQVESDIGSRFKGNVEVGGLLLCKMPTELLDKRKAYHQQVADRQMQSVDNSFMNENDPRMPLLRPERNTRNGFGGG